VLYHALVIIVDLMVFIVFHLLFFV